MKARATLFMIMLLSLSLEAGIGEGISEVGHLPVALTAFSAVAKSNVVIVNRWEP